MTFYTVSFGDGLKREGRRLSHLVRSDGTHTYCGRSIGNQGALWVFSDAKWIPSEMLRSTPDSQKQAVACHITCRTCLTHYNAVV